MTKKPKSSSRKSARSAPETPSPAWLKSFKAETRKHVLKGDYASALTIAREALKRYPSHPDTRFQYAKLLGDWADEVPPARRKKLKAEALVILRSLVRSLAGRAPEDRFPVSLNYYYQSEDFAGMYRFGKRFAQAHGRQGHYAQGIGAGYLAFRFREKGSGARARSWGRRASAAWKKYSLQREDYYFPHYVSAMALAAEGDYVASRAHLERAAKLSQRKVTDGEFADVLAVLEGA